MVASKHGWVRAGGGAEGRPLIRIRHVALVEAFKIVVVDDDDDDDVGGHRRFATRAGFLLLGAISSACLSVLPGSRPSVSLGPSPTSPPPLASCRSSAEGDKGETVGCIAVCGVSAMPPRARRARGTEAMLPTHTHTNTVPVAEYGGEMRVYCLLSLLLSLEQGEWG